MQATTRAPFVRTPVAGHKLAIASLALAAQLLPPSFAYGAEMIGTLGSVIGKASIVRDGKSLPVKKGMEVFATDELVTGPKTAVKINFTDGGNFMAFEDSKVKISEYKFQKNGKDSSLKSAFDVAKGKVRFFVKPEAGRTNDTKFKTSNAVMGIRGTSGFIDASSSGKTQLVVLTGKVEVSNPGMPGKAVLVPPNQMTDVVGTRAPTAPRAAPPALVSSINSQASRVDPRPDTPEQPAAAGGEKDEKGEKNEKNDQGPGEKESKGEKSGPQGPGGEASPSDGGEGGSGAAPVGADAPASTSADGAAAPGTPGAAGSEGTPASSSEAAVRGPEATGPAPEPLTVEKKTVFNPDGKSSIVVNDAALSAVTAPPVAIAPSASTAAAVRSAQPPTDVIKKVNDVVKTNSDKAVESRAVTQAAPTTRTAAEAPKTKSVRVKVVLPPAP